MALSGWNSNKQKPWFLQLPAILALFVLAVPILVLAMPLVALIFVINFVSRVVVWQYMRRKKKVVLVYFSDLEEWNLLIENHLQPYSSDRIVNLGLGKSSSLNDRLLRFFARGASGKNPPFILFPQPKMKFKSVWLGEAIKKAKAGNPTKMNNLKEKLKELVSLGVPE